jgi:hypothetical protein
MAAFETRGTNFCQMEHAAQKIKNGASSTKKSKMEQQAQPISLQPGLEGAPENGEFNCRGAAAKAQSVRQLTVWFIRHPFSQAVVL